MSKSHIFVVLAVLFLTFQHFFDVSALFAIMFLGGIKGGIIENWEVKIEDLEVRIGKWSSVQANYEMLCGDWKFFVGNCCRETARIMLWRIWQIKWRTKSEEWIIHMHCGDTKFSVGTINIRIVEKQQGYCSGGYDKLSEERRVKSE